jgi:Domain of unknown function (DUF4258)
VPFRDQLTPHAIRRAQQRKVPIDLMEEIFLEPDFHYPSDEPGRVVRGKVLSDGVKVELVVDADAYTVVTVWVTKPGAS